MSLHNKKRSLWIIVGITVLNGIGMTIIMPLFPFLLGKYVSAKNVAVVMSAFVSIFAICTFFAAPIFGALSDRYGRKSILLVSLLGSFVGYLMLGIGGTLWILFFGRIIDGLTAGNQSALFAYITDSTEPNERGKWFGYIGGAIGLGFMIGPPNRRFAWGRFYYLTLFLSPPVLHLHRCLFSQCFYRSRFR